MNTARSTAIFLFLSLLAWPLRAQAEPPTIQKIGLVNLAKVFKEYEETKISEAEMEKVAAAKQQEREKKVGEIRDMRDELALLNEEAREERRKSIEERMRDLATFDQSARDSLRDKRDAALEKILEEIEKVVKAYAKENGFELILSDRAVLFAVDPMDITDDIIKILNQEYAKKG